MASTAELLSKGKSHILKHWEDRTINEIEVARHQQPLERRNAIDEILDFIIFDLEHGHRAFQQECAASRKHGISRAESHEYSIQQMIYEFHILRECIFQYLEEDSHHEITKEECEIIFGHIEQVICDSATYFYDTIKKAHEKTTSTLTHDLRNPISTAKICTELIQRKADDKNRCLQLAGKIEEALSRLDKMLKELLDSSRLNAGIDMPEFGEMNLAVLAKKVVDDANLIAGGRIKLISPNGVWGYWSEKDLKRLLENLISNAIKYGDSKRNITVKIQGDNVVTHLCVHNYGAPIKEKYHQLFNAFHRSHDNSNGKEGWGLGLSTVAHITSMHGGQVEVNSNDKEGTVFKVIIPRFYKTQSAAVQH
jgi:signal transduction histidine kinase